MKYYDILFYLGKFGDLVFRKYWVYTYIFGFLLFLNGILMIFLDRL